MPLPPLLRVLQALLPGAKVERGRARPTPRLPPDPCRQARL